ncbi:MAG: DedA family protein [Pseudomonadota bacterium]
MTDYVLGLIPDYGLYVIFMVVALACLAAPLPASVLVLAAGSFAAAGDLVLWQVFAVALLAFILGDQLAFSIAKTAGPRLLGAARRYPKMDELLTKGDDMLQRRGTVAVLISHTIASPTCPYVTYLCGVSGMSRAAFSGYAMIGAVIWAGAYVGLGFAFSNQLTQVSTILSNFFGLVISVIALFASAMWLYRRWRDHAHG